MSLGRRKPLRKLGHAVGRKVGRGARGRWAGATLLNGDFATDTVWTKGAGWTIAAGVATHAAGTASVISQPYEFVPGGTYRVGYTVSARTVGGVRSRFSGGTQVQGVNNITNGTFSDDLVALAGNVTIAFASDATFDGSIDAVTITRLT